MMKDIKTAVLAAAFAISAFASGEANASGWIVGLVDGTSIVTIDPASRMVTSTVRVRGAAPLLGIDVRPANGMLYGLTSNGDIVTIDPKSGNAMKASKLGASWKQGMTTTFDFNPVADRLRLMNSAAVNLRVNVDDGKAIVDGTHRFKDGDVNAGKTPRIVAGAYTNSWKGTKATTLFNIDAATGTLVTQAPPNDGVLNTVGSLGIAIGGPVAFDIVASKPEKNEAWIVTGGSLYSVDLKTGKAMPVGRIGGLSGALTDIAWID
jgi:hypothetical protein